MSDKKRCEYGQSKVTSLFSSLIDADETNAHVVLLYAASVEEKLALPVYDVEIGDQCASYMIESTGIAASVQLLDDLVV